MTKHKLGHGYTVNVLQDEDAPNPRKDYDNFGRLVCWHRRYDLGDEMPKQPPSEYFAEVIKPIIEAGGVCFQVYLYDHGGITVSIGDFADRWDSGPVGYIYATKEQIDKEFLGDRVRAEGRLKGEIEEYARYLEGDVYVIDVMYLGDSVEIVGGFVGEECALEEAKAIAYCHRKRLLKKRVDKVKALIKHRAPLSVRTKALNAIGRYL